MLRRRLGAKVGGFRTHMTRVRPRLLHSTGQLYKGGGDTGLFLQFTADDPLDLPIPGEPHRFGGMKAAQALGGSPMAPKAEAPRPADSHCGWQSGRPAAGAGDDSGDTVIRGQGDMVTGRNKRPRVEELQDCQNLGVEEERTRS